MKITSEEFKQAVEFDPAWASRLTEAVEITDFCDMKGSKISHLSPMLTFTGKTADGWAADFSRCKNLKTAEGTFQGFVPFSESGIEEIGALEITKPSKDGVAATFDGCKNLKTARGKFAGTAFFTASGVESIADLQTIAIPSERNPQKSLGADFCGCPNLRSPLQPEWNSSPNKLAHYFARLLHKLDNLAERLLEIGQQCIAKGEHLEKSAAMIQAEGKQKILGNATSLKASGTENIHAGIDRIEQSWKDLFDFVADGIQHGATVAIVNLIERQIEIRKTRKPPQPIHGVEIG